MQNKQKMQSSVFGVLKFTKPQKHMFFWGWGGVKAVVSYKLIQLALVSEVIRQGLFMHNLSFDAPGYGNSETGVSLST